MEIEKLNKLTSELIKSYHLIPSIPSIIQELILNCLNMNNSLVYIEIIINIRNITLDINLSFKSQINENYESNFFCWPTMKYLMIISQITLNRKNVNNIVIKVTEIYSRIKSARKLITEHSIFVIQEFITQMSILHHFITWILKKQTCEEWKEELILSISSSNSVLSKIIEITGELNHSMKESQYTIDNNIEMKGLFLDPLKISNLKSSFQGVYVNNRWLSKNNSIYHLINLLYFSIFDIETKFVKDSSLKYEIKYDNNFTHLNNIIGIYIIHISYQLENEDIITYHQQEDYNVDIEFCYFDDILHCLYLLIYPIFSQFWILSQNENIQRRVFNEIFQKFGYNNQLNLFHQSNDSTLQTFDSEINISLNENIEDNLSIKNKDNKTIGKRSIDLLFDVSFCSFDNINQINVEKNIDVSNNDNDNDYNQSWSESDSKICNSFQENETIQSRKVSIMRLSENILETKTKDNILLEVLSTNNCLPTFNIDENKYEKLSLIKIEQEMNQIKNKIENEDNKKINCCDEIDNLIEKFHGDNNLLTHIPINLSKDLLNNSEMKIIGQVEKKFILILSGSLILCGDQHAIHERILLENMKSQFSEIKQNNNLNMYNVNLRNVKLNNNQWQIVRNIKFRNLLNEWKFQYNLNVSSNLSYLNNESRKDIKNKKYTNKKRNENENQNQNQNNHIQSITLLTLPIINGEKILLEDFIEYLDYISKNTKFPLNLLSPPFLNRILSSKACHSAIKFGDELTNEECFQLIQLLFQTQFPFQCAHGRPSIVPLFSFPIS